MKKILQTATKYWKKTILIEVGAVAVLTILLLLSARGRMAVPGAEMERTAGSAEQGSLQIDETSQYGGTFAKAVFHTVKKGNYLIHIFYDTDYDDNGFYVQVSNPDYDAVNVDITDSASAIALPSWHHQKTIHAWLGEGSAQMLVNLNYCGAGKLTIEKVVLQEIPDFVPIFAIILIFLLFDLWIYDCNTVGTEQKLVVRRGVRVSIICITLLASLPLLNDYLVQGTDLAFHLYRIEGIREGLLSGQFPVRIQPNWWQEYGYAASVFYGDLFLYVPAVFMILGVSLQNAYKCYVVLINLFTAWIAYKSFYGIWKHEKNALFGAFLYTAGLYRLEDIYVRGAVGEFTALTFLPLIILGVYRIYTSDENHGRSGIFCLTAGLTGCIESHMLTCEMVGIFLVLFGVLYVKRTFSAKIFPKLCIVAAATVLCNLSFLLPFLDLYKGSYEISTGGEFLADIQQRGAFLSQMFQLFINGLVADQAAANGTAGEMGQSVGLAMGIVFLGLLGVLLCYREKIARVENAQKVVRICVCTLVLSAVAVYMSSNSFPYGWLQGRSTFLASLLGHIQFPWRFLGIALALLSLAAVCLTELVYCIEGRSYAAGLAVVLSVLVLVSASSFYYRILDTDTVITRNYEFAAMHKLMDQTEYLPVGTSVDQLDHQLIVSDAQLMTERVSQDGAKISFRCNNQSGQEGYADVPLFFYPCYRAADLQTGQTFTLTYGTNNRIRIVIPAGYTGTIQVAVHERKLWRLAEIISLLTVIGLIVIEKREAGKRRWITE